MNEIPIINQVIKNKRKKMKLSQSELAKLLNKSKITVTRYETGSIIPHDTLTLICERLKLDFYELLTLQNKENIEKSVKFYNELILFYDNELTNKILERNKPVLKKIDAIIKILEFYYNVILNFNKSDVILYSCDFKNDKFYIKQKNESDPILILNIDQATKLVNELQIYFNFQIYHFNLKNIK